jgi:protein-S-isoprenylcysteine O-methyltransferase Ste14
VQTFARRGLLGSMRVLAVAAFVGALVWYSHPTWTTLGAGVPLVLFGAFWRVWAAGHLVKSKELAVSGPYRHVQHPLYVGRFLILTGFCLIAWWPADIGGNNIPLNLVFMAGVWVVFLFYYLPRKKRVEGSRLLKNHGQAYEEWIASVPFFVPRLTPWGPQARTWTVGRFRTLNEGWMMIILGLVVVAFIARAVMLAG